MFALAISTYKWLFLMGWLLTFHFSSFSYFELYLGLAKMVENFELVRSGEDAKIFQAAGMISSDWEPVQLTRRKEWVAATLTDPLLVTAVSRSRS